MRGGLARRQLANSRPIHVGTLVIVQHQSLYLSGHIQGTGLCQVAMGEHDGISAGEETAGKPPQLIQCDVARSGQALLRGKRAFQQCGLDKFRSLLHRPFFALVFQSIHQVLSRNPESLFGKGGIGELQQYLVSQLVQLVAVTADTDGNATKMGVDAVVQPGQPGRIGPGVEVGVNGVHQQLCEH